MLEHVAGTDRLSWLTEAPTLTDAQHARLDAWMQERRGTGSRAVSAAE